MYGEDIRRIGQAFDIAYSVRHGTVSDRTAARSFYGSLAVDIIVQAIIEDYNGRKRLTFEYINNDTLTYRVKFGTMRYGIIGQHQPNGKITHMVRIYR